MFWESGSDDWSWNVLFSFVIWQQSITSRNTGLYWITDNLRVVPACTRVNVGGVWPMVNSWGREDAIVLSIISTSAFQYILYYLKWYSYVCNDILRVTTRVFPSSNTRPCSHDVPEITIQALKVLDNPWMNVMRRYTGMLLWSTSLTVYIPHKVLCLAIVQDMTNSIHRVPIKQTEKGAQKWQKTSGGQEFEF